MGLRGYLFVEPEALVGVIVLCCYIMLLLMSTMELFRKTIKALK